MSDLFITQNFVQKYFKNLNKDLRNQKKINFNLGKNKNHKNFQRLSYENLKGNIKKQFEFLKNQKENLKRVQRGSIKFYLDKFENLKSLDQEKQCLFQNSKLKNVFDNNKLQNQIHNRIQSARISIQNQQNKFQNILKISCQKNKQNNRDYINLKKQQKEKIEKKKLRNEAQFSLDLIEQKKLIQNQFKSFREISLNQKRKNPKNFQKYDKIWKNLKRKKITTHSPKLKLIQTFRIYQLIFQQQSHMFLGNFVTFTMINCVILVLFKRLYHTLNLRKLRHLLFVLYLSFLSVEIYNSYNQPNDYKFLQLHRNFTQKELLKQKKTLLAKYHPDNYNDDSKYIYVQELYEVYTDKNHKNYMKLYDYFKVDLMNIHFDKQSSEDFSVYSQETINNLSIEYYILAFIVLFLLKEINSNNKKLKIISLAVLGICGFLEFSFYNFYDLQKYLPFQKHIIDQIKIFDSLTYLEIQDLIKRSIMSIYFLSMYFYVVMLKENKKMSFNQLLQTISDKLDSNKDMNESNFQFEIKSLEKKVIKKQELFNKNKKISYILMIISLGYIATVYFGFYQLISSTMLTFYILYFSLN